MSPKPPPRPMVIHKPSVFGVLLDTILPPPHILAPSKQGNSTSSMPSRPAGAAGTPPSDGFTRKESRQITETWKQLEALLRKNGISEDRLKRIHNTYRFARREHGIQRRESGEPYILHTLRGAIDIVDKLGFRDTDAEEEMIEAFILHDILEDTRISRETLELKFGKEVLKLVDGVTKFDKTDFSSKAIGKERSLEKLFSAMLDDVRIVIIKLADRLDNMKTLDGIKSVRRQRKIAQETFEIFVPLAELLGLWAFKEPLEDLAFKYSKKGKIEYEGLSAKIEESRKEREALVDELREELREKLLAQGIKEVEKPSSDEEDPIKIKWRTPYNLFVEQSRSDYKGIPLFDVEHIVINVTERNIHRVYGLIHKHFKYKLDRDRDYTYIEGRGFYRSMNTDVIWGENVIRIMIRDFKMEKLAKMGIAAKVFELGEKLGPEWRERVSDWMKMIDESADLYKDLKAGMDEIFVYTPKGKRIFVPKEWTVHDLAFKVHTDIGLHAKGAVVSGVEVPLDTKLRAGSTVNIIFSKSKRPNRRQFWDSISRDNAKAWETIRLYFGRFGEEKNVEEGRNALIEVFDEKLYLDYRDKEVQQLLKDNEFIEKTNNILGGKGIKIQDTVTLEYNVGIATLSPVEVAVEFVRALHRVLQSSEEFEVEFKIKAADIQGITAYIAAGLNKIGVSIEEMKISTKKPFDYLKIKVGSIIQIMQVINALKKIEGIKKVERISEVPTIDKE